MIGYVFFTIFITVFLYRNTGGKVFRGDENNEI